MIEPKVFRGRFSVRLLVLTAVVAGLLAITGGVQAANAPPHSIKTIASTVPANGDLNPYGVAVVPNSIGNLTAGDILVSNFNDSANLQGTGTTIVEITPSGVQSLFAQINPSALPGPCTGGVGLTTALSVLQTGWVIVGSLPTTDGTSATAQAGCLLVLSSTGQVVETFYGSLINGPWDMTALDQGNKVDLFYTNVLNGTVAGDGNIVLGGNVVRLTVSVSETTMPAIESLTVIGSGFAERTDPAALVIGPTGVALSGTTLYVNDSLSNRIASIPNATTRMTTDGIGGTLTSGGALNDPLGLTVAFDGSVYSTNGDDGYLVIVSPSGTQTSRFLLDNSGSPPGAGALFGAEPSSSGSLYYVDDATNSLRLFQ